MRAKIILTLLFLLANSIVVSSQNDFILQHSESNITIYNKAEQNRLLIEYKGDLTLENETIESVIACLLYTSPSPRD